MRFHASYILIKGRAGTGEAEEKYTMKRLLFILLACLFVSLKSMGQEVFIYKKISVNYYEDGKFYDYMKGPDYKYGMRVRFGEKTIWTTLRFSSGTYYRNKDDGGFRESEYRFYQVDADGNVVYESKKYPCDNATITEIIVFSPNREKMYWKEIYKESDIKHISSINEYVLERKGDEVSNEVPSWVN